MSLQTANRLKLLRFTTVAYLLWHTITIAMFAIILANVSLPILGWLSPSNWPVPLDLSSISSWQAINKTLSAQTFFENAGIQIPSEVLLVSGYCTMGLLSIVGFLFGIFSLRGIKNVTYAEKAVKIGYLDFGLCTIASLWALLSTNILALFISLYPAILIAIIIYLLSSFQRSKTHAEIGTALNKPNHVSVHTIRMAFAERNAQFHEEISAVITKMYPKLSDKNADASRKSSRATIVNICRGYGTLIFVWSGLEIMIALLALSNVTTLKHFVFSLGSLSYPFSVDTIPNLYTGCVLLLCGASFLICGIQIHQTANNTATLRKIKIFLCTLTIFFVPLFFISCIYRIYLGSSLNFVVFATATNVLLVCTLLYYVREQRPDNAKGNSRRHCEQ